MSAWREFKQKSNKNLDFISDDEKKFFINNQSIFVAIPSLQEVELLNTVKDCFLKAKNPKKVFVGICNQRIDDYPFEDFSEFKNVRTIEVKSDYMIGLGMGFLLSCWLAEGEDFFFRIDRWNKIQSRLGL